MKKILLILCCLVLTFSLFACNNNTGNNSSNGDKSISSEKPNDSQKPDDGGNEPKVYYSTVTLDGDYSACNFSDCTIKAYKSDFYSLKADSTNVNFTFDSAKFENGKTVVTFVTDKPIENGYYYDYNNGRAEQSVRNDYITWAKNIMTWQLNNGGWYKEKDKHCNEAYKGTTDAGKIPEGGWFAKNGQPLGTIDNDGTYSEMIILAEAYHYETDETVKASFKASFLKGMEFLTKLQTAKGGFAQVYPRRGSDKPDAYSSSYSDYATYNDNAMASVLKMLNDIKLKKFPFLEDFIDKATYDKACDMLDKGIDFTLKAQIQSNGEYAGWCSQHNPETYAPAKGRAFEPVSISSSESVGVIKVLLSQQDNPLAIERAEKAIAYFKKVALQNMGYTNKTEPYFHEEQGKTIWYRFYEIDTDKGVFGDRDGSVHYDINEISEERRTGYSWAGSYVDKLISVYEQNGYFDGTYLVVNNDLSGNGVSLKKGSQIRFN